MNLNKKAQIWYIDFMVGILIFTIAVVSFFYYGQGFQAEETADLNTLLSDVKRIGSSLVSEGTPSDWTNETVKRIGLTDGNAKIDTYKWDQFNGMNYTYRRQKLTTTKNYYIYLQLPNGTKFNEIGKPGTNSSNLVQTTRIVSYNNEPVRLVVHLWE